MLYTKKKNLNYGNNEKTAEEDKRWFVESTKNRKGEIQKTQIRPILIHISVTVNVI